MRLYGVFVVAATALTAAAGSRALVAQEPAAWGAPGRDALEFHTFSIAAIDPRTGEVGVAVTTRVPCVGNGVPWVRAGVGAVATQANTRTEYGQILLDALAKGEEPARALQRALAADSQAVSRQVGVIAVTGKSAQHTGSGNSVWDDLVVLMAEGVETGTIDTVRPEHTPEAMGRPPRADDHGGEVYVYRRAGQACLVCGSRVRTEILVGRNLFWCAHCQPRFRSRAVQ